MGISIIAFILIIFASFLVSSPRTAGKIFSNDNDILDLFEAIRFPFALMMIFMNMSVACEIIMGSMGKGPLIFKLGLVGSWLGQVPAVALLVTYWKKDIVSIYYGSSLGYALLVFLQLFFIANADWEKCAQEAKARVDANKKKEDEDK